MEELKERAAAPRPLRRNQACYVMWRRARQALGKSFKGIKEGEVGK
jgi:hypothetical protein